MGTNEISVLVKALQDARSKVRMCMRNFFVRVEGNLPRYSINCRFRLHTEDVALNALLILSRMGAARASGVSGDDFVLKKDRSGFLRGMAAQWPCSNGTKRRVGAAGRWVAAVSDTNVNPIVVAFVAKALKETEPASGSAQAK